MSSGSGAGSPVGRVVISVAFLCVMAGLTESHWGPYVLGEPQMPEPVHVPRPAEPEPVEVPRRVEPEPAAAERAPERTPERVAPTPDPEITARQERFVRHTQIRDPILFRVYEAADTNGTGRLEMFEIQRFQTWVYSGFRYEHNAVALAPDEFGAAGGGDCEDFALYTCGLLKYWGEQCWVGSFEGVSSSGRVEAHAVALLRVDRVPPGMHGFLVEPGEGVPKAAAGTVVIPIDYDRVGGYTNATPSPARLRGIYEPVAIYGSWM
ncbi:MAG: hypothetical protein ACOCU4_04160 [Alkalispirochaeta sp.]